MPRALLSVSDKTGIVDLGRGLVARGFELVSTGGTARVLSEAALPVTNVSTVTGFPEMMDGRVKTLHPAIHGGILARRDRPDDLSAVSAHGFALIDVVVVNLYPFAETASRPGTTFDALVEEIDIGGPSLVRAAAKNFRDVLVVVHPSDYADVLRELDRPEGASRRFRFTLARKAFEHTGHYDVTIADTLSRCVFEGDDPVLAPAGAKESDVGRFSLQKVRQLRYGENPHQSASLWELPDAPIGLAFVQGKELSYTNLLDLDSAWRIVAEFSGPAAVVIKHTNPCGAATGSDALEAYTSARDADALSAFGGVVGLNRPIDAQTAEALCSTFIEAVIAPDVLAPARAVLARKDKMRVLTFAGGEGVGPDARVTELRSVFGGFLLQDRDRVTEAHRSLRDGVCGDDLRVVTKRSPTPEEWESLRFAWRICAHVKSNAVIFTDARRTLAMGAGQMSRVDAVNVAVMKARGNDRSLAGSAAASDAFFPFRDGLDAIAAAGAKAIVQPGGSVRDAEVIAAADEHGLAMVFTGRRHFRH
jgi:phosphoribosylaminoimidazolecarboxamide formyltransferase/IMP cyclohydrolase